MARFLSISFFKTYAAWLLLPFIGIFFGILASTAKPVIIGMGISSFIGIVLLKKPAWNTELIIILGLVAAGIIPIFLHDNKMVLGITILGFVLQISVFYRLITTPQVFKSTPSFVWVALLFYIYAIVNSILQFYSIRESVGGFKRYFQAWGLLFGLCWMDFSKKDIERWRMIIFITCTFLQIPFALYEKYVVAPSLEAFVASTRGLVPIDVMVGTFGSDTCMATSLLMVFAFLLSRFNRKIISAKKCFWISLLVLSPLLMGETKSVIIFFPILIITLYRKELLSRPHYAVAAVIFTGLFTVIAIDLYAIISKMSVDELIWDSLRYNVYDEGYGDNYLNRTTVLTFWAQHQNDPISFLFGNGLGSSQEGKSAELGSGHIDMRYQNYGVGLTGVSILLWELGVLGLGLFLLIMVLAWSCAGQLMKQAIEPTVYADAAAIQASIVLFSVYPLHSGGLQSEFGFQVMFTAMLGYLAWLHRQQHNERKS